MDKRKWYQMPVNTSLLGFGAMRLTTIDGEIEEEKALDLIDKAYVAGVNYFDTAMPYTSGKNEVFLGKALSRYPRESYYLATKLTLGYLKTKEEVENALMQQLKNLQTDYIDFYLLHALSKDRFELMKQWEVMDIVEQWKKEGKIKHIGFSFHDDYNAFCEIIDYYPWEFCQIQLNYMDTNFQQGIKGYEDLVERQIPVVIMEPVKGGKLAAFSREIESLMKKEAPTKSIASWAMRWIGSLDGVKVVLSGMNEIEQLEDNIKTFTNFEPLSSKEYEVIDQVIQKVNTLSAVNCTNCMYCMPCTFGVHIPGNFRIFNDYVMYEAEGECRWRYGMLQNKEQQASACVDCRECIEKCPQKINIPEELRRMLAVMKFLEK